MTTPEPAAVEPAVPVLPFPPSPTNGRSSVDPAVLLLVEELRRGNDQLRAEMVGAIRDLTVEVQELRRQAPGRLSLYALSGVVVLALVAVFGLVASRGIEPGAVAHAVHEVAPGVLSSP